LDTYEIERRRHVEKMTQLAVNFGRLWMMRSQTGAALRDAALSASMRVPAVRRTFLQGRYRPPARYTNGFLIDQFPRRSAVGRILPQPWVRTWTGDVERLDDMTGTGWRILGWQTDPTAALSADAHERVSEALSAQFVTLCGPGQRPTDRRSASREILEDTEEATRPLFGRHPFLVVRPDGYIYANPSRKQLEKTVFGLIDRLIGPSQAATLHEASAAPTW
jgi:3-(3-hydroxy-phenyl)propionate hydroxylase